MSLRNLIQLLILAALWGASFLFLRIAVPTFGPAMLIEIRVLIAALFLYAVTFALKKPVRLKQNWRHFLIIGLLNSALPFLLFAYAAQSLSASLLAILNSTAPLFGAAIAVLWLRQPISFSTFIGLALGIIGVAILVGTDAAPHSSSFPLAVSAALCASLSYGIASTYAKRALASVGSYENAHGSLWAASLLVLPVLIWAPIRSTPSPLDWGAVTALGLLCTGAAYLLYFRLIQDVGPMQALSVTFLIPVFGVFWGVLFLDETVGWPTFVGGAIILLGTALTNGVIRWSRPR